jgi:hypothetical protein
MADPLNYNALDHYLYLTTHDDKTFRIEGAQDGDFLAVTYDNDTMSFAEGAQGDVQASQRVASLGSFLFTGQWGSASNKNFAYVFNDQNKNSLFLKKAQIKRINSSGSVVVWNSKKAWLVKTADWTIGSQASPRAWTIKVSGLEEVETEAPS